MSGGSAVARARMLLTIMWRVLSQWRILIPFIFVVTATVVVATAIAPRFAVGISIFAGVIYLSLSPALSEIAEEVEASKRRQPERGEQ